jgi:hypothetical protein
VVVEEARNPQIFGGNIWVIVAELFLLGGYLWLAVMANIEITR